MIQVNHLEKSFEGFHALKGVDMHVEKGAIYGLVGPNGAGKSTLIRHITGVYKPDAGEVLIAGKPVYENKKVKAKFSYIPDEIFYFMQADTMEMKRFYQGIYPAFDEKLFYRMQEFFPNIDVKRSIRRLSKGMQKQVAFWLAICCKPDILILDEPTLGLDVMSREAMLEELQEYLDSEGTGGAPRSVLISSHISSDLEKFCDDIYMIDRGRIVLHGETDVLLDSYGILKVDERQYQALDRRYLLAGMREAYGYRLLTNERRYYQENYPDLVMEKGSIDDILILTARGEKL